MKRQRYVNTLVKPRTHLALSDKSFSIAAPAVWNDLSIDLRTESSYLKYHKSLESAMFNSTDHVTSQSAHDSMNRHRLTALYKLLP